MKNKKRTNKKCDRERQLDDRGNQSYVEEVLAEKLKAYLVGDFGRTQSRKSKDRAMVQQTKRNKYPQILH